MRRGTNAIAPMTAAAALLSSFVRAVLTWRHRTVTSNCKQPDDTSSAASPLIARTTPNPLRSRRHQSPLRTASSSPPIAIAIGVVRWLPLRSNSHARRAFDRPIGSVGLVWLLHIAVKSESDFFGINHEGGGGSSQTVVKAGSLNNPLKSCKSSS